MWKRGAYMCWQFDSNAKQQKTLMLQSIQLSILKPLYSSLAQKKTALANPRAIIRIISLQNMLKS